MLEPPAALIAATGLTELLQELVQDADVALCCHGRRRAIAALNVPMMPLAHIHTRFHMALHPPQVTLGR